MKREKTIILRATRKSTYKGPALGIFAAIQVKPINMPHGIKIAQPVTINPACGLPYSI